MSIANSREQRTQENLNNSFASNRKCRIPRLTTTKQRLHLRHKVSNEKKPPEVISLFQQHVEQANPWARSSETRPRSGNISVHNKDVARSIRSDRVTGISSQKKSVSAPVKRNFNEKVSAQNRNGPIIIVPENNKTLNKFLSSKTTSSTLPDQDTIKKCEDSELIQAYFCGADQLYDSNESLTSGSEKLIQVKINWEEKKNQYEQMKIDLNKRQNSIMKVFAALRDAQEKLALMGHSASSPILDDLRLMNVAQMSPQQLLQLCAETAVPNDDDEKLIRQYLDMDLNRLNSMPSKLYATCEAALNKRKELIDWLEHLKNNERKCPKSSLARKINEFNAENDILYNALQTLKAEFLKDVNEVTGVIRKRVNDTISAALRNEDLTYELSDLRSQNYDLQKQIRTHEKMKPYYNKTKIEELEKTLKDEKIKCKKLKDRIMKAENQVKLTESCVEQLETALKQSEAQVRHLERTISNLCEQNEKSKNQFDEELNKLNKSIKENARHLNEIAEAKGKLEIEKEDLKKRLSEMSNYYNESIDNMKHEIKNNITKIIEIEKKYIIERDEKYELQSILEEKNIELAQKELDHNENQKLLEETEAKFLEALNKQKMMDNDIKNLLKANEEFEKYKNLVIEKNNSIAEMQKIIHESCILQEKLKNDINDKTKCIESLEQKITAYEKQTKESDSKMQSYENQLLTLKNHILKLQENFGELEKIHELHEVINEKNNKLNELATQNEKLSEAVQKQAVDLDSYMKTLVEQEHYIEKRNDMISVLVEKEKEQGKIIALLHKKVKTKTEVDTNINQQLKEKDAQILSLRNELDKKIKQINQLEKNIILLDDRTRKLGAQKKMYQEKVDSLENLFSEYEVFIDKEAINTPREHLDSFFKILENELESSVVLKPNKHNSKKNVWKEKYENYIIPEQLPGKVEKSSLKGKDKCRGTHRKLAVTKTSDDNFNPISETFIHGDGTERDNHNINKDVKNFENMNSFLKHTLENDISDDCSYTKKHKMFRFASHKLK